MLLIHANYLDENFQLVQGDLEIQEGKILRVGTVSYTHLQSLGVRLVLGEDYLQDLNEEIIFRTPGMKYHLPQLEAARKAGSAVTSEMEVFFELCPCKIYAVTGSDGKTTTTSIIAEFLKDVYKRQARPDQPQPGGPGLRRLLRLAPPEDHPGQC